MGRAQLADQDFCRKAQAGDVEDIDYCVGCNQGCYDGYFFFYFFFENTDSPCITCLRNPAMGRETECELTPAEKPETVLVAGGRNRRTRGGDHSAEERASSDSLRGIGCSGRPVPDCGRGAQKGRNEECGDCHGEEGGTDGC